MENDDISDKETNNVLCSRSEEKKKNNTYEGLELVEEEENEVEPRHLNSGETAER